MAKKFPAAKFKLVSIHAASFILLVNSIFVAPENAFAKQTQISAVASPINSGAQQPAGVTSVKQEISDCEKTLKEMGESVHRLKRAATDLYAECRQQLEMAGEIDFIGGEVIPIMPVTAEGFGPEEYLPPRKKYVDLHMSQLGQLIPIMSDEINSLVVPSENSTDGQPLVASMQTSMQAIKDNYVSLQNMTVGPPYNNTAIATQATAVHDLVGKIDGFRKKLYHLIRGDKEES